jgi:hypothetical protein
MNPIKRFVYRYVLGVMMLHNWGEKSWPWNVRSIWHFTDFDVDQFKRYKLLEKENK